MESIRSDSRAARLLADAAGETLFTLVDVGCSGGIDGGWAVFGERLQCFAFDPSLFEIERLTAAESRPHVHYINGFVGLPIGHPSKGAAVEPWRQDPWPRLSVFHTLEVQQSLTATAEVAAEAAPSPGPGVVEPAVETAPAQAIAAPADDGDLDLMRRNLWHQARLADPDKPIVLPDFLAAAGVKDLDFVKIDVDGPDFEILQSLETTLREQQVLGVMLEVSFHGSADPHFNTFHNMDRFMRAQGFDLFDLTVRKYALSTLPRPYLAPHPYAAQTTGGRPFQGDALYVRDLNLRRLEPKLELDADKLLKLAAIFALFGLLDHAAEILILFRDALSARLDIDHALDVMTQESQDMDGDLWGEHRFSCYKDLMAAFEADDLAFYDAWGRRQRHQAALVEANRLAQDMAAELRSAVETHAAEAGRQAALRAEAEERLAQAQAACAAADAELAAVRRTLSWRVTAGLRALRRRAG